MLCTFGTIRDTINGAIGRVGQKVRGEPELYTLPLVRWSYQRRNLQLNICPWPSQHNFHPKVGGSAREGRRIDLVASLRKWFQSLGRFQGRPPSLPMPPLCSTAATRFISTISILLRGRRVHHQISLPTMELGRAGCPIKRA